MLFVSVGLNPLSRVNCILMLYTWKQVADLGNYCLNPLSRVNCILIKMYCPGLHRGRYRSQSPKSGQLHSNPVWALIALLAITLGLNPLSRVNCILIGEKSIEGRNRGRSQSPKSGQLHSNWCKENGFESQAEAESQSPKSGQLHSNRIRGIGDTMKNYKMSQSPKSGQLHSNYVALLALWRYEMNGLNPLSRVNCILIITETGKAEILSIKSQSPKSGQLHSNARRLNIGKVCASTVSIP